MSKAVGDVELKLWVLIKPAESVKGEWIAHCLDIGIVSQGRSREHALEMIQEALAMAISDDLGEGLNPLKVRKRAPKAVWDELHQVMHGAVSKGLGKRKTKAQAIAVALTVRARRKKAPQVVVDDPVAAREVSLSFEAAMAS